MANWSWHIKQLIIVALLLSGCTEPPTSLAKPVNDGRTEWTKDGKAKIIREHAEMARRHDAEPKELKFYWLDGRPANSPRWIVITTICGTGVNNMVHGGYWPYSSTRSFKTKDEAKKWMGQMCEPKSCILIYGSEQ